MARTAKIDHEGVLSLIREAIVKEELAIPVYDSHISAALFWSGLPEEVQREILAGLETLTHDSAGHVQLLRKVEAIVAAHPPAPTRVTSRHTSTQDSRRRAKK